MATKEPWKMFAITDRATYETLEVVFAEQAHKSWQGWMGWLFSKGKWGENGEFIIDPDWASRWKRLMETDFEDLTEVEARSDILEAREWISVLARVVEAEGG